jgi:hypothetical protein
MMMIMTQITEGLGQEASSAEWLAAWRAGVEAERGIETLKEVEVGLMVLLLREDTEEAGMAHHQKQEMQKSMMKEGHSRSCGRKKLSTTMMQKDQKV